MNQYFPGMMNVPTYQMYGKVFPYQAPQPMPNLGYPNMSFDMNQQQQFYTPRDNKSNLLIHSSLDEKIDKLKGKDKGSTNKSNKNLLNAINSQLFDKFQINPFQNSVPMQPMQHFQPMGPTHQLNNSIGYMPTQFVNPQPTMPMNYHSPYIANSSASAKRNRRESKEESEEITHFSGDEIDLKLNAAASAKKTQSKFGKENANVMKDGKEIKLTEQKRVNTNKVMKELNENLEDFHFEFSRQISKTSFKERKLKESTRKDQC